jgi:hypothetical protein
MQHLQLVQQLMAQRAAAPAPVAVGDATRRASSSLGAQGQRDD